MKKVYDAVVTTGKYTDRASGKEKSRYLTVGAVMQDDEGRLSLKLEAIPLVGFNGWINFYPPKEREQKPQQDTQAPPPDFDDSSIPF